MGKGNGNRHKLLRFIDGIAEHHALISCAYIRFIFTSVFKSIVNTLCDIGRLFINEQDYFCGMTVKAKLRTVIADTVDGISDRFFNIHNAFGGNLSGKHYCIILDYRFNCHTGVFVLLQISIQYCV